MLAYPSLDEGFGFPLLDAMQLRIPDRRQRRRLDPRGRRRRGTAARRPDDVDTLAANLGTTLANEESRAGLIAAGDRRWHQFSWDLCAEQLTALYRRLAARSGGAARHDRAGSVT
ncbi:MAG: hypothetical protein QM733_09790 [Ilumatobacteraceae bacterium]